MNKYFILILFILYSCNQQDTNSHYNTNPEIILKTNTILPSVIDSFSVSLKINNQAEEQNIRREKVEKDFEKILKNYSIVQKKADQFEYSKKIDQQKETHTYTSINNESPLRKLVVVRESESIISVHGERVIKSYVATEKEELHYDKNSLCLINNTKFIKRDENIFSYCIKF